MYHYVHPRAIRTVVGRFLEGCNISLLLLLLLYIYYYIVVLLVSIYINIYIYIYIISNRVGAMQNYSPGIGGILPILTAST